MIQMIDYETIADFYLKICSTISKTIYEARKDEATKEAADTDFDNMYGSFERAKSRAHDVLKLKKYYTEPDFEYYGLEQLSSTRHRIEHFLEDSLLTYPDYCYTFNKYDDIIIDYYKPIRLKGEHHESWEKYYKLNYKRVMINYGLIHDLKEAYDYVDEDEKPVIDEMMRLCKKLDGYDEEMAND